MKKILTLLAVTLFAFSLRAQPVGTYIEFWFNKDAPVTYPETDDPLVENEVFRVLAVFPNASIGDPKVLPFKMSPEGEPILTVKGSYAWMRMTVDGVEQTYVPVTAGNLGVPGTFTAGFPVIHAYLDEEDVPEGFSDTQTYYTYLVAFDARQNDGTVLTGLPTNINHWGAVYGSSFQLTVSPPFSCDVNNPLINPHIDPPTPKYDPYVEGPDVPEGTTEEEFDAAIDALEALVVAGKLTTEQLEAITKITNPDVASIINGCDATVDDEGVATFVYEFGVSAITLGENGNITVAVDLGEGQSFVKGVAVTLVDLEGKALTDVTATTVGESGKSTAKVTIQVDPDNIGTLIFKAKAEK